MAKVKAIPKGRRSITPNLVCSNADGAIDYYKKVFDATEVVRVPGPGGKIMHAELKIGDSSIFVNDPMSESLARYAEVPANHSIYLHLYVKDANAVFQRAIQEGAQIKMPLQDMFWGDRYGQIIDPFGQQWGIATHIEDVSPEEMSRRQQEMFGKAAHQN
ncbi:MAG: VOC family protein [Candidatus Acidiferrales bacterium]